MVIKRKKGEVVFDIFNYLFLSLFCASTLYPFIFLLLVSLGVSGMHNSINPFKSINTANLSAYIHVIGNEYIIYGFISTLKRTLIGTPLTLIVSILTAYPLSKRNFPNRGFWTGFMVFTMFFNGGIVPNYLLIRSLGLIDKIWALVLPHLIATFTMIIMRNYFMSLPDSLEEAAKIDGANDFIILFMILVPICAPIIATVTLWTVVYHWNAWFDSMIYITSSKKQVLQVALRRIVLEGMQHTMEFQAEGDSFISPDTIKAAVVMVVSIPIIIAYPFAQKYFVKGIMMGSLKG